MRTIITVTTVAFALVISGCVPNEQSLYIEHLKVQPSPPDCTSSAGDPYSSHANIDLALASEYVGFYLVTNGTMVRQDYDNIRNESNGIFIDGVESYIVTAGGDTVGSTSYYEFQMFIPPESSEIVPGLVISSATLDSLRDAYGCQHVSDIPLSSVLEQGAPASEEYPPVYSHVRFLGHTQGGKDLETTEFSYLMNLSCNNQIDWASCVDPCIFHCLGTPPETSTCNPGVMAGNGSAFDCRTLYGHLIDSDVCLSEDCLTDGGA